MKKITAIMLMMISAFLIVSCDNSERQKAAGEKIQGSTQKAIGKMTADSSMENEGKANQTKGDLHSTKEDVKDIITGQ